MDPQEIWKTALTEIELSVSRANFVTWFKETGLSQIQDGCAVISVPNAFSRAWLENKYNKFILRALHNITPEIKEIQYTINQSPSKHQEFNYKRSQKKKFILPQEELLYNEPLDLKEAPINTDTNLNPKYNFSNFIVGSFNELAHAAAQSVMKNLGSVYNPLFIYGGVGLGKTHLIQAIGNGLLEQNPNTKIKYLPAEKFMGEIVDAITNKTMNQLKERYRVCDLLIMDDIQFIAGAEKMQEEFFHTFNALYEKNKQIIISSDRPPAAIATLEKRLRSRFEGGMVIDIGEPQYEERLSILKTKLAAKNAVINDEILEFIASSIKSNIRELEGALNRIILASKMIAGPIGLPEAKKILAQVIYAPKRFTSPKKIIKVVADFYEIGEKELVNKSRKKEIVKPRQVAMFLLREELKCSFPSIGERLGKKDHTTAIHAYKKIMSDLKTNQDFSEEMRLLKEKIYTV